MLPVCRVSEPEGHVRHCAQLEELFNRKAQLQPNPLYSACSKPTLYQLIQRNVSLVILIRGPQAIVQDLKEEN